MRRTLRRFLHEITLLQIGAGTTNTLKTV